MTRSAWGQLGPGPVLADPHPHPRRGASMQWSTCQGRHRSVSRRLPSQESLCTEPCGGRGCQCRAGSLSLHPRNRGRASLGGPHAVLSSPSPQPFGLWPASDHASCRGPWTSGPPATGEPTPSHSPALGLPTVPAFRPRGGWTQLPPASRKCPGAQASAPAVVWADRVCPRLRPPPQVGLAMVWAEGSGAAGHPSCPLACWRVGAQAGRWPRAPH